MTEIQRERLTKKNPRKWLKQLRSYSRLYEFEDMCPLCYERGAPQDFEIHHVIPICDGGGSPPWNLICICKTCHAILESGKSEDAIKLRIECDFTQLERYGLLFALYQSRIAKTGEIRTNIRLFLSEGGNRHLRFPHI